jgi:DNA invertase Pin-like site-specific DNA recombinase
MEQDSLGPQPSEVSPDREPVALHVRVPSADQNCRLQLRELSDNAAQLHLRVVGVHEDVMSLRQSGRPGLTRLMDDAAARKLHCVLVWKLDRFGRSLVDCLKNIQTLESLGVRSRLPSAWTRTGRTQLPVFFAHVLGAAAEFERSLILERSLSSQIRYRQDFEADRVGRTVHSRSGRGLPPHRPAKIFGCDQVVPLRCEGLPLREIAKRLGLTLGTVIRTLNECSDTL